jgi:hypothetical protein
VAFAATDAKVATPFGYPARFTLRELVTAKLEANRSTWTFGFEPRRLVPRIINVGDADRVRCDRVYGLPSTRQDCDASPLDAPGA